MRRPLSICTTGEDNQKSCFWEGGLSNHSLVRSAPWALLGELRNSAEFWEVLKLRWSYRVSPSWSEGTRTLYIRVDHWLDIGHARRGMALGEVALFSQCDSFRARFWQFSEQWEGNLCGSFQHRPHLFCFSTHHIAALTTLVNFGSRLYVWMEV